MSESCQKACSWLLQLGDAHGKGAGWSGRGAVQRSRYGIRWRTVRTLPPFPWERDLFFQKEENANGGEVNLNAALCRFQRKGTLLQCRNVASCVFSVCRFMCVCGGGQRLILGVILSLFPPYYFEAGCFISERPETH